MHCNVCVILLRISWSKANRAGNTDPMLFCKIYNGKKFAMLPQNDAIKYKLQTLALFRMQCLSMFVARSQQKRSWAAVLSPAFCNPPTSLNLSLFSSRFSKPWYSSSHWQSPSWFYSSSTLSFSPLYSFSSSSSSCPTVHLVQSAGTWLPHPSVMETELFAACTVSSSGIIIKIFFFRNMPIDF